MTQVALLSAQQAASGAVPFASVELTRWRTGRITITLGKLRSLTAGLQHLAQQRLRDPLTDDDITRLIIASGFALHDLTDTTHQIIARIHDRTEIKHLLTALRNATDLAIPITENRHLPKGDDICLPRWCTLRAWERPGSHYPRANQIDGLLRSYNRFIHDNGFPELTDDEIAKVVAVAERDHARWRALSSAEKQICRTPRRPPMPDHTQNGSSR